MINHFGFSDYSSIMFNIVLLYSAHVYIYISNIRTHIIYIIYIYTCASLWLHHRLAARQSRSLMSVLGQAIYCLLAYWGDKYTLLRGSRCLMDFVCWCSTWRCLFASRRPPGYTKSAIVETPDPDRPKCVGTLKLNQIDNSKNEVLNYLELIFSLWTYIERVSKIFKNYDFCMQSTKFCSPTRRGYQIGFKVKISASETSNSWYCNFCWPP